MKLLKILNPENVSPEEVTTYRLRDAVRAVVFDEDKKIALLYVATDNYYKLPGGGVEADEDKIAALFRECHEEIGCTIEIIDEIGSITEYRKIHELNQTSYCFLAKVTGSKGLPEFTENEKEKQFEIVWLLYNDAVKALSDSTLTSAEGRLYIGPRDLAFLEVAESLLN